MLVDLQALPDEGSNRILVRLTEENPDFYAGILERFSQTSTEIYFKNAMTSSQSFRLLVAMLKFRYSCTILHLP